MSLQQFFDDDHRATADTAVRVFPAVARTPRSMEPRRWNNPARVLFFGMPLSVGLTWIPWLPPALGVLVMLLALAVATWSALGCFAWPESRTKALMEGAWVARQCGYRAGVHGDELIWVDPAGALKHADVVRGNSGWDLVLTDRKVAGVPSS